ncbi:MAG: CHAT domain-containing protein, partial [Leptolyngbyaceae bacterium]|nr:CHAT domain-containing protein [Leptolyngbyaceae bacterium]
ETFYQELATQEISKAEALRQAQIRILQEPQFRRHPYYWAAFILVGNWL